MEASPELAACEVCGRAVAWPTAGPHSRVATKSRGCSTSHAAVGFSTPGDRVELVATNDPYTRLRPRADHRHHLGQPQHPGHPPRRR
jgi:hypothetical protein